MAITMLAFAIAMIILVACFMKNITDRANVNTTSVSLRTPVCDHFRPNLFSSGRRKDTILQERHANQHSTSVAYQ